MKPLWLAALLLAVSTGAQQTLNRGQALDATAAVRVYTVAGSVKVTGWSRDSVALRGSLGKGNSLHMGGSRSGMKMFVEAFDESHPADADLELYVPARAKVWIKTATASIDVTNFAGSLDLYVVSGNISVRGNPADVNAEAIDGSIRIDGSPSWVRAKSASGDVTLNGSTPDVACTTVSGRIDVNGSKFERARFESVTGPIRFAGSVERGGLASFDSHSGSIDIGMPSGAPADFDIISIAGPITNKLTSTRPAAGRYGKGSALTTTSGEGGTRVIVRSFKGGVSLYPKS